MAATNKTNNLILILVILLTTKSSLQDINDNQIQDDQHYPSSPGPSPLDDVASEILKEQNLQNIGNVVGSLMGAGLQQQLGENAGQILQGLGSMMSGNSGKVGLDPAMMTTLLNMMNQNVNNKHSTKEHQHDDNFDMNSLLSIAGTLFGTAETRNNGGGTIMDYLPMILQTYNAFVGPEAEERERDHKNHAWLLPPIVEKIHLMIDHFMNSDMGQNFVKNIGAEKFVKIFQDENGRFSYPKMVQMMENHSFRKHWIRMVTDRISLWISYVADPNTQKKYLSGIQYFINSILRSQGFPKTALFDPTKPTETLTTMVQFGIQKTFNMKVSARQYVKPLVDYIQDVFRLAQKKGILGSSMDSRELSDKLADTINLDIIEPMFRVNRAYRFATKHNECDRYVMCLVNQGNENEESSLGGLKPLLSKSTSLVLSWFLSSQTGTSFWSFYHYITEDHNCEALYKDSCKGFHIEELQTTTEYIHNEL